MYWFLRGAIQLYYGDIELGEDKKLFFREMGFGAILS